MSKEAPSAPKEGTKAVLAKAVASSFVLVVAPVLVAFGVKYSESLASWAANWTTTTVEAPTDEEESTDPAEDEGEETESDAAAESPPSAASPTLKPLGQPLRLFNGQDLTGFYTYLGSLQGRKAGYGKNNDPDKVFTAKKGILHISGEGWGLVATEKSFENYHISLEYRWGEGMHVPRRDKARKSGLLLHCDGEDGVFRAFASRSIVCQIMEGATGNLHCAAAASGPPATFTVSAEPLDSAGDEDASSRDDSVSRIVARYRPGAAQTTLTSGVVARAGKGNRWKNKPGFRGRGEIESKHGEWNKLECFCHGDRITVRLNGKVVNEVTAVEPRRGRIALASQGNEIEFRNIVLQPLEPPAR